MTTLPISVSWQADTVRILDQRLLPGREEYLDCRDIEQVFTAIKTLSVRGAPAIGIAAAYGLVVGLGAAAKVSSSEHLMKALNERRDYLASARPTAVKLVWALDRMMSVANSVEDIGAEKLIQCLIREAETIHTEDKASCRAIGEAG